MIHSDPMGQTEQDELMAIDGQSWTASTAVMGHANLSVTAALESWLDA